MRTIVLSQTDPGSRSPSRCRSAGMWPLRTARPLMVDYCIVVYYTILYYTILYYTILYYTILYYTILYYTILYTIVTHRRHADHGRDRAPPRRSEQASFARKASRPFLSALCANPLNSQRPPPRVKHLQPP